MELQEIIQELQTVIDEMRSPCDGPLDVDTLDDYIFSVSNDLEETLNNLISIQTNSIKSGLQKSEKVMQENTDNNNEISVSSIIYFIIDGEKTSPDDVVITSPTLSVKDEVFIDADDIEYCHVIMEWKVDCNGKFIAVCSSYEQGDIYHEDDDEEESESLYDGDYDDDDEEDREKWWDG